MAPQGWRATRRYGGCRRWAARRRWPRRAPVPDSIAPATAAGILGARHAQFAQLFFSDLLLSNMRRSLVLGGIRQYPGDHHAAPAPQIPTDVKTGSETPRSPSHVTKKGDGVKPPGIRLFGQEILTEEQMKGSHDGKATNTTSGRSRAPEFGLEPGQ
jgi:hypothetical protein